MTAEEWRQIAGYPGYLVSSHGRVVSTRRWRGQTNRELVGALTQHNYRSVQLCRQGDRPKRHLVHVLVAEAFLGPRPVDMPHTRHLDGDPLNNAVWNLLFGTASENAHDRVQHGTHNMARRTHCPLGHAYTEANTYRPAGRADRRACRTCRRERSRAHKTATRRAAGIPARAFRAVKAAS